MLSCHKITLSYQDNDIISNFDAQFAPNSMSVISGPNGAGKTSLLRSFANLLPLTSGQIKWFDADINELPAYKKNLCYVAHYNAVFEEMSVFENLQFWAELRNSELLLPATIAIFNLEKFLDSKAGYLSVGWKKKLALARLVLSDSKLWLIDEADANLDLENFDILLNLLKIKASQGGIILASSHNPEKYQDFQIIRLKGSYE